VREFHSDNNFSEIGPDEIIILECIIPEGFFSAGVFDE